MGKLLQVLSFIFLGILVIGTTFLKQNPAFWLASPVAYYQYLREIILVVLAIQLMTLPPRNIFFRVLSAGLALTIAIWALAATNSFEMRLLDTIGFIGSALTIGVAALEYDPKESAFDLTSSSNSSVV